MESRLERHRKVKEERTPQKKTPLKVIGGLTLAAVACFAIGIGASYWTSNSKTTEEQEAASPSLPVSSSQPTNAASTQPSPTATANALVPSSSPTVTHEQAGSSGQVKLSLWEMCC